MSDYAVGCRGGALGKLREASDGFLAKRGGVAGDGRFPRLLDAGDAPIEGRDQLLQITRELGSAHRHRPAPSRTACRREAFQTSPQLMQRQ